MTVFSSQISQLSTDDAPSNVRGWLESVVVLPLNRTLDLLRTLLNRGISVRTHMNAQVFERRFIVPSGMDWTAERLDTASTLSGQALGIVPLAACSVDGAGHDSGPLGGLGLPVWREVVVNGGRAFRLVFQDGLTAGDKVRLVYLAWGQ